MAKASVFEADTIGSIPFTPDFYLGRVDMSPNDIKVSFEDLIGLASLKCGHVILSGNKDSSCDKRDLKDSACCGSCYARRIAERYLKKIKEEKSNV
jgi:hypothetical protein